MRKGKVRVLRGTGRSPGLAASARPAALRPAPFRQAAVSRRARNPETEPRVAADAREPQRRAREPRVTPPSPAHPEAPPAASGPAHPDSSGCSGSPWRIAVPALASRPAASTFPRRSGPGVSAARADWARPREPPQTPPSPGPDCGRGGWG